MALFKSQRRKIYDYPCKYEPDKYINSEGVFEETGLNFPEVYKHAEGMVAVAKEIAKANGVEILMVPSSVAELHAYGGDINYGDERVGPRPGKYTIFDPKDFLKIPEPDLNTGLIAESIKAVKLMKDEGYTVSLHTTGAVYLMSGMIDLIPVFKALRKRESYMLETLTMFKDFEVKYYKALAEAGADIISMAELCMPAIMGPEIIETIVEYYLHPFHKEAAEIPGITLHMCPKSSYSITDTGYGTFVEIQMPENMGYGEAMIEATDDEHKIFGRRCIANMKMTVGEIGIQALKLK